jgi:hypothetical protein
MIEKIKIGEIKSNPNNPRTIKDDKFKKLVKSIKDFPEMLEVRPIVVDDDMIVLGGNMRLKACIEAGLKEVSIIKFKDLTEDKKKEFIVKDNVGYGEWDFEVLNTEWDTKKLVEWGLDIDSLKLTNEGIDNDTYTRKIEAPIYEPKGEKPKLSDLYNKDKYDLLIEEINKSTLNEDEKHFLRLAAGRHIVFNFQKIADYYAHSEKETQLLMENQALIIIDFNKAIELGFVNLSKEISNIFLEDYDDK